jgi:hypothetical protein
MEPVKFYIKLKEGADADDVKSDLERLAGDLPIQLCYNDRLNWFKGTANPYTYEKLFSVALEYETRIGHNINRGPFLVREWAERRPAKVPDTLKDKIKAICISHTVHLTD